MGHRHLGFAIILQAIDDYRTRRDEGVSTTDIEEFFESKWCNFLLQNLRLTGRDILERLRNE